MQFEGAVVKEQGITFAIVVVKPHILTFSEERDKARAGFSSIFPHIPIILMAQDSRGTPSYQGRRDIVDFLANIDFTRIPWKKYNYN